MLLNFCDVQRQLIQTHNSILKLYKEELGSAEEPWKGKSKELVCNLISRGGGGTVQMCPLIPFNIQ